MTSEHDLEFLQQAYQVAGLSCDPSTQNGAVLIPHPLTKQAPVSGWNHFYTGIPEEYEDREIKYKGIEHAERDAIYHAARRGVQCGGATLYCPWVACRDCARAILGSGISKMVFHADRLEIVNQNWEDSIDDAFVWLRNSGIELHAHHGSVPGALPILVSGRRWDPSTLEFIRGEASV
jgi:dCMP deaminase